MPEFIPSECEGSRKTKGGNMQIDITARHLQLDDDFKVYINEKIKKLAKYASKIESARVIFSIEKLNNITEITLTGKGFRLVAVERDQDVKVSFDICLTNIEKQLKRTRGKVKNHKVKTFFEGLRRFSGKRRELPAPDAPIIRIESFATKPMSPEEAALELTAFNKDFIVFRNSVDDKVSVLYKRKDGNYGLIEP